MYRPDKGKTAELINQTIKTDETAFTNALAQVCYLCKESRLWVAVPVFATLEYLPCSWGARRRFHYPNRINTPHFTHVIHGNHCIYF